MSDIALTWMADLGAADVTVTANDLTANDGLETAVYLSLFTDRQAEENGGWWGDAVPVVPGDLMGSRLWLLGRAKQSESTLRRAEEHAREALKWLLDDRVAATVTVTAAFVGVGVLELTATLARPGGDAVRYQYDYTWAAQAARRKP
jgi:phage gp46-like protein